MLVRVLGDVEVAGESLAAKRSCVLAALALSAGTALSPEALAHRVWGAEPPDTARGVIYSHIAQLRRRLEGHEGVALSRSTAGYRLDLPDSQLDVARMRELSRQAREAAASGDHRRAVGLWSRAEELWRGQALQSVDGAWAERTRRGLHAERFRNRVGRVESELALGHHAEVLGELRELTAEHPLDEAVAGHLMLALYRCGRQDEALRSFGDIRARLRDELGNDPTEPLARLHRRILRNDPALTASPEGQRALAPPAQLPTATASFTGRAREARRLADALTCGANPGTVLVSSVDGMGGIGKTSLVVQVAHSIAERFPDGQLFIDLHGFSPDMSPVTPAEALDRLLRGLGVPGDRISDNVEDRAAEYRSALSGRRVLIVLDNAAGEEQVRPLLPGTDGAAVVVTSRRPLAGLDDVRSISLDVLDVGEAITLFSRVSGLREDEPGIAEIVELCGRLPLAVRIAAARLRSKPHWDVARLRDRIADERRRLPELELGDRSVSATFAVSFREMDAARRRLFALLGLIPGPHFEPGAVVALTGDPRAESMVDDLVDARLVECATPGRFHLHDLLRLYAGRRAHDELSEAERGAGIRRLLSWYTHSAHAADAELDKKIGLLPLSPTEPGVAPREFDSGRDAADWLSAELPNLTAAIDLAATVGPPEAAWLLTDRLSVFFPLTGRYAQWKRAAETALRAAREADEPRAEAAMWMSMGWRRYYHGDFERARVDMGRAVDKARSVGDNTFESSALIGHAWTHYAQGDIDTAIVDARRAMAVVSEADRERLAAANGTIGAAVIHNGRLRETTHRYREKPSFAVVLNELGEYDRAIELATIGLGHGRDVGLPPIVVVSLTNLAHSHAAKGERELALGYAREALDMNTRWWGRGFQPLSLLTMALCLRHSPDEVIEFASRARELTHGLYMTVYEVWALELLAEAHVDRGEPERAIELLSDCLELARREDFPNAANKATTVLARARLAAGDAAAALSTAEQALAGHRDTGLRPGIARALLVLADALEARGDAAGAAARRREASELAAAMGAALGSNP